MLIAEEMYRWPGPGESKMLMSHRPSALLIELGGAFLCLPEERPRPRDLAPHEAPPLVGDAAVEDVGFGEPRHLQLVLREIDPSSPRTVQIKHKHVKMGESELT